MDIDNSEIRERIRQTLIELRESKGLTQTEVGELVGKTKTSVSAWETGASLPDLATLYRLSKIYKKSVEYMFGERDEDMGVKFDLAVYDDDKVAIVDLRKKMQGLDLDAIGKVYAFADFLKNQKKEEGD